MATLTVKEITGAVLWDSLDAELSAAAGGGDTYTWGRDVVLLVLTGATASQTITATRQTTSVGSPQGVATLADVVATSAADTITIVDTRDASFRDSSGNVIITYSAVVNMTVVPVKLPFRG